MRYLLSILLVFIIIAAYSQVNVNAETNTIMDGSSLSVLTPKTCSERKQAGGTFTPAEKQYCGAYEAQDLLEIIKKIINYIYAISGSLALVAFFWGGILYMISGATDKVKQAKDIMQGAFIGIFIIFVSFSIIELFINKVFKGGETDPTIWENGAVFK